MDSLIVYLNDIPVGRLTRAKFLCMATKTGLSPRIMDREIDRMLHRIEKQAPIVAQKLSVRFPSPCYERIVRGVLSRCRQLEDKF